MVRRNILRTLLLMALFLSALALPVAGVAADGSTATGAVDQTTATFGRHRESVEDMRVKVSGGHIRVNRKWTGSRWEINRRWRQVSSYLETIYTCRNRIDLRNRRVCSTHTVFKGIIRAGVRYNRRLGSRVASEGNMLTKWGSSVNPRRYFMVETRGDNAGDSPTIL